MKKILFALFFLAVSVCADNVNLAWDASPTPGVSYRVYQSVGTNTAFSVARETGTTTSAAFIVTVPTRFYVTAFNANGESTGSNIITFTPAPPPPPAPPTNLRATTISASRIDLHWSPYMLSSVFVERNQALIAVVPNTQSYYLDTGLRRSHRYSYRVRGTEGEYSNTVTARTFVK